MSEWDDFRPDVEFAVARSKARDKQKSESSFAAPAGSGEADPLVSELRKLAATDYPLCPEARLLLEMAVDAQLGKPIDVTRLLPNDQALPRGRAQETHE